MRGAISPRGRSATLFLPVLLSLSLAPALPAAAHPQPTPGSTPRPAASSAEPVAPGLSLTTLNQGAVGVEDSWTIQIPIPSTGTITSPPDRTTPVSALAVQDRAKQASDLLAAAGIVARVEKVDNPRYADLDAGTLGFTVRVGRYANQSGAAADLAALSKFGWFGVSLVNTAEDGLATTGPWVIRVLTVDPAQFGGTLAVAHGANLAERATTSAVAARTKALAAVNGGFFVMQSGDGVPGDPVGVHVEGGRLLSEATNGRPVLRLLDGGRRVQIGALTTTTILTTANGEQHQIEGINRYPGKIRNCGGDAGDAPTMLPLHDLTCTDPDELVEFTPEYGTATPSGTDGIEVAIDTTGTVVASRPERRGGRRGWADRAGYRSGGDLAR